MLATMHAVGRLFPHGQRAPDVEPVAESSLRRRLLQAPALQAWRPGRDERVSSGFYKSHAQELVAP
jgi:magnesium-protoporphyrin O-methyltransferase